MWTNGSRVGRSTPAKARRTGNPSPSNPVGAVVTETTGRWAASDAIEGRRGRATVSAVTAGIRTSVLVAHATFLSPSTPEGAGLFPAANTRSMAQLLDQPME